MIKKGKSLILFTIIVLLLSTLFLGFNYSYNKKAANASEEKIENIINSDVELDNEVTELNALLYVSEGKTFYADKDTGAILGYVDSNLGSIDIIDKSERIDEETAKEIAYNEAVKYSEDFFDYDYEYEINSGELYINIVIHQLSEAGNKTGDTILVRLLLDGSILSLNIYNNEDASIADNEVKLSESEAKDIAYLAIVEKSKEFCTEFQDAHERSLLDQENKKAADEPQYNDSGELYVPEDVEFIPLEIYISEATKNNFEIEQRVFKGQQLYTIKTEYYDTNKNYNDSNLKYSYIIDIDADASKVVNITYYQEYMSD
jgi:hypothetical protein